MGSSPTPSALLLVSQIVITINRMKILSIETSCDETAISIIEAYGDYEDFQCKVIANELLSQATLHTQYGGVFPTLAKREHAKNLPQLLQKALANSEIISHESQPANDLSKQKLKIIKNILEREPELYLQLSVLLSQITKPDIDPVRSKTQKAPADFVNRTSNGVDAIAITNGPGLAPALWVGVNFARALSVAWELPIVPVNHMEGHVFSAMLKKSDPKNYHLSHINFPALALLISGGHTELVLMKDWSSYELLGATRDDAVGEAFDKVARLLGLNYPGGPEISKLATKARKKNLSDASFVLPRPMIHTDDYNFSFSGLKTAVLTLVKKLGELSENQKQQIAREFEDAVADVFTTKVSKAISDTGAQTLLIGGGVSANTYINNRISKLIKKEYGGVSLHIPNKELTGDNALMIAVAGYFNIKANKFVKQDNLTAEANLTLY